MYKTSSIEDVIYFGDILPCNIFQCMPVLDQITPHFLYRISIPLSINGLVLRFFFRFHSAVCFADIWKSAYEKEED